MVRCWSLVLNLRIECITLSEPVFQVQLDINPTTGRPETIFVPVLEGCPHFQILWKVSHTDHVAALWSLCARVIVSVLLGSQNCGHVNSLNFSYLSLALVVVVKQVSLNEVSIDCAWVLCAVLCMGMFADYWIVAVICSVYSLLHRVPGDVQGPIGLLKYRSVLSHIIVIKHRAIPSHLLEYNCLFIDCTSNHEIHSESGFGRVPDFDGFV